MSRFGTIGVQYFTDDNKPLSGGKLFFYLPGTTTDKPTFADVELTIPNTQPVVLDAAGRQPNIFFDGSAKAVLTDADGAVIETRDPVGDTGISEFETWDAETTYSQYQVVTGSDGLFYVSLINGNFANDPTLSPTEWKLLTQFIGFESANNGYVWTVDNTEPQKVKAVYKNSINNLTIISSAVASSSAAIDFTGLTSAYDYYIVEVVKCRPATDGVNFLFRTSSDNGAAFDSGASDYSYGVAFSQTPSGVTSRTGSAATTEIVLSGSAVGNDANQEYISLNMHVLNPAQVSYGTVYWDGASNSQTTGNYTIFQGVGQRRAEAAFNAIRFFFSSGNIAEGIFTLYGVRTS
jgi:hypothetical protein